MLRTLGLISWNTKYSALNESGGLILIWVYGVMKYGCCKECSCMSKKIRDPGCDCGNHEISEESE